jgi:glyoxylase-like metal-dependent hydrolase (beta-lactamase superfamily II)
VFFLENPKKLAKNLYLIDDFDLNTAERTGSYVLTEEKITIIETASSPSLPYLLNGLKKLEISPEDIQYIIVTHIHLDHAGGAGVLLQHCPNAKVVVHPKGARHLADPSRLIAGARSVYGDKFSTLFEPILPVPQEKLLTKNDQEELKIGPDCTLVFFDTPGHANHHFSIYYPKENGMFVGDTTGIYYPQLKRDGVEFYLPSTSPNQFSPDQMLESVLRYEKMNLSAIYFGHYGMSRSPNEVYKQIRIWLQEFLTVAQQVYGEQLDSAVQVAQIANQLMIKVITHLEKKGIKPDHPVFEIIRLDLDVGAMGLVDYFNRLEKNNSM